MKPGAVIAGRFEIEREAGVGGMGTVYRAIDLADGGVVALKLLGGQDPADEERFEQESAILARLAHPAIVRYVAHGSAGGVRYLAMEWLEGEDLADRVDREPLGVHDSLTIGRRAAEALSHAHENGVIHRDVKPSNLFAPDRNLDRLKVLDFGIARITHERRRLTRTGLLVGTPGYLAPELIDRNMGPVDGRADVFSLGCVLFECLTGRPPFVGDDAGVLLAKIVIEEPPLVCDLAPQVPGAVGELISRMLAKSPQARPDSVELLRSLERLRSVTDRAASYDRKRTTLSLAAAEQRIAFVVMAGSPGSGHKTPPPPATGEWIAEGDTGHSLRLDRPSPSGTRHIDPDLPSPTESLRREVREGFGARVHDLPDGRMILTVPEDGTASDQAMRAAHSALAVRKRYPELAVVVVAGPASVSPDGATGPVVDSAARLLRSTTRGHVRVDGQVAGLLDGAFELHRDGSSVYLRRARGLLEPRVSLLGKRASFLGRGRELSALAETLAACELESQAHAVLVTGAAGIGKSRLLQEFLEWMQKRPEPVTVLFGFGSSVGAGAPFAMLGQALRRHAGVVDADPPDEQRRKLRAMVGERVAPESSHTVAAFLGEITNVPFPDGELESLRAARANPQLMADSTRRAFLEWIAAECAYRPVLLLLEDLHWGDSGTVGLVDAALLAMRDAPLMVLALARPDVQQMFPRLWEERRLEAIRLGPLSAKASERLIREALGGAASPELIGGLTARADGNPFYLEELIRAAHEGRADAFPDSLLAMVQARLVAEGAPARRVLRAASVFGERFTLRGTLELLGGETEREEAQDWIARLLARELLVRGAFPRRPDDPEYAFSHALVREAAYAMLTDEDRVLGHRMAGMWLEADGLREPMVLAEHFRRGGEPTQAARWYRRAAEGALKANDLAGAIDRADLGLVALMDAKPSTSMFELPSLMTEGLSPAGRIEKLGRIVPVPAEGADETRGALLLSKAEAHLWRGELALAEAAGEAAWGFLRPGAPLWFRAAGQTVIALGKQGRPERIEALVENLLWADPEPEAQDSLVMSFAWSATFLLVAGRRTAAEGLLERLAGCLGPFTTIDPGSVALIHQAQALKASTIGDLLACLDHLEAALAAFEQAGDLRNACTVRANMGFLYTELGALERGEEALREAEVAAERLGLQEMAAFVLHNLGHVRGWRGDLVEAERLERSALASFRAQGEPRLAGLAGAYLSEIVDAAGRPDEALALANESVEALVIAPPLQAIALAALARALLGLGRVDEAVLAARRAHELVESLGSLEEGEAGVRLAYVEALLRSGDDAEMRRVLHRARTRLMERADRIRERSARERYLRMVPGNARTLLLAERHLTDDAAAIPSSATG